LLHIQQRLLYGHYAESFRRSLKIKAADAAPAMIKSPTVKDRPNGATSKAFVKESRNPMTADRRPLCAEIKLFKNPVAT
jgi:hypothetical protein